MTNTTSPIYLLLLITIAILLIIIAYLVNANKKNKKKLRIVENHKKKQNILLNKLLPEQTAKELQNNGKVEIKNYEMVSVLFADIKEFTHIMNTENPESTINTLDLIFKNIDNISKKYNIEKIKTIGDGYMCAGGVPMKNKSNPIDIVMAALEIQDFMQNLHKREDKFKAWNIRIGIHTGTVSTGVIGSEKLSYDIWGETVNTASRMETSGSSGEINISRATYLQVKDFFDCEYRGEMYVKHNMLEHMYYVKNIKPELGSIKQLNKNYYNKINAIHYYNIEEIILDLLDKKLEKKLYYHNINHTIDVINCVELIGDGEQISEEDINILKTAALFHDTGFIKEYDNHEENSCLIAQQELSKLKYNKDFIDKVCQLILVTDRKKEPKNIMEQIISDADLDYLGREDFIQISASLYKELRHYKKIDNIEQWTKIQLNFLEKHHFYTKTAKENRDIDKTKQLQKLKEN